MTPKKSISKGRNKTSTAKSSPKKHGRQTSDKTNRSSSGRGNSQGSTKMKRNSATAQRGEPLIDHQEIREWAEARGAKPACVKRTGGKGDVGMIRLDFPGYSGEESLQAISWEEWFEKFDNNHLALIVQETTAEGRPSNFNKLVKRGAAHGRPRARAAR